MQHLLFLLLLIISTPCFSQQNKSTAKPLIDSPLYICVEDFFQVQGKGLAVTGRITSGKVSVGETITIKGLAKDSIVAKINSIEKYGALPTTAVAGDNVGLLFSTVDKEKLKRSMVVTVASFGKIVDTIEVEIKLLPGATPIQNGSDLTIYMHCNDIMNCKAILPSGIVVKPGQTKRFKVKTSAPVFIIPDLLIALRNNGRTTGSGKLIVR